jgi:hypothetical protein
VGFPIDDWSVGALISDWRLGWWWTRPRGYESWTREDWVKWQGLVLEGVLHKLQPQATELEPAVVSALCHYSGSTPATEDLFATWLQRWVRLPQLHFRE